MFRPVRWLLVMSLLLSPVLLAAASGAERRTMDYAWLLFLKVNEPPQIINVWADQEEIAWPDNSVLLNATVIDDPRDALTYEWTELDGVAFSNRFVKEPTATFTPYGTFHLQLTVTDDGGLTSTATVTVIFNNSVPQVNAGSDKQIIHPTNSVNLDATVTDNPSDTLTYKWSRVGGSGPGTATFADSSKVDTKVTLSKVGTYVLQLWASDGEKSDTDEVTVEYSDAPVTKIEVIRAVGDSFTEGVGDYPGLDNDNYPNTYYGVKNNCQFDTSTSKYKINTCAGYPPKLESSLENTGRFANDLIIVENGFGGRTTKEAIDGTDGNPTVKTIVNRTTNGEKADMAVVLLGTNDAYRCNSTPVSASIYESNMKKIIAEIKAAGLEPVLVKVAKTRTDGPDDCYSNTRISEFNTKINSLDNDSAIKVTPLNLYRWFELNRDEIWKKRPKGTTTVNDYVHPTSKGYDSIARELRKCLLGYSTCNNF